MSCTSASTFERARQQRLAVREDRPALERLLRCFARAAFASERLEALGEPGNDERHRHHYRGVFAPHSPLRRAVTACAGRSVPGSSGVSAAGEGIASPPPVPPGTPVTSPAEAACAPPDSPARRRAAYAWVRLLARIYEVLPLLCPRCGSAMRLIAFITPPDADEASLLVQSSGWEASTPSADPGYAFDQTAGA